MRFILQPLLALPRSQTRSFLMHSHFGLPSDSSHRLPRLSIVSESFSCVYSHHYSRIRALFWLNVQSLGLHRSSSLIGSYLRSFVRFSLVSAPSCFERSFCTFSYNFVSFPALSTTFCDSDLKTSSVCVHIVPRRILAYQVCVFMICQYYREGYQRSCIGILYDFSSCFSFSSLCFDVVSR